MVSADQMNSEGIRLSQSGKYDKALLAFNTALEMEPANPRIIYNMALVFIRKEDYATAQELLIKAIDLEPEEGDFHNDLGLCYYRSGKKDEALAEYDRALELNPTHSTAWNNRGVYYFQKEDYPRAEECFRTSVNLNPDWEDSWFNLRDTYEMLGERKKWKEAHKRYRELSRNGRKS
ncbi:MAG: tetratricopeptide repeat protein [Spirochaetales bacterium]|nr:tetratricopeptide repeat protein [Spirochaetales bacterium]